MTADERTEERQAVRTSLYLVRRADALLGALRFFLAGDSKRHLQFLAQSDYWAWEIDNLIYSFTKRRATWRGPRATARKLGQLGIVVNAKLLRAARWQDPRYGRPAARWRVTEEAKRVAPVAMLKEVVDLWNDLITRTETEFIRPMQKEAERWNIQTRPNLESLRRTMPELEEMHDDDG